ncbi:MAG: succinyl-diaminopimelate desuccinylase [SAR324 cluster bacterium]|nr:succinyl-diaminopimelate desuccinylase [SAR324 cluster bacterium]
MQTRLNQFLMEFLRIPSEITREKEFCDHLENRFKNNAPYLESYRLNHNLVLRTSPRPQNPTLGWFGHIDTVVAQEDQPPHETEDFIHGCGSSDMKSGLAVMTALLEDRELIEKTPINFVFVFYEQEEGDYEQNGLQPVLEKYAWLQEIELAFALEPTNNTVQNGCVGGLHARLNFQGKRAHSARPWEGENAIHKAGQMLVELGKKERIPVEFKGLTFYEVINATLAQGGQVRNAIPDTFMLNLNYRFAPGKDIPAAKQEVLDFVANRASVEFIDESPSGPCYTDNPWLQKFLEKTGLPQVAKQAWTDVARLALFEIPAVNFGPGDTKQAHQRNEIIAKAALHKNYEYFVQFLKSLQT